MSPGCSKGHRSSRFFAPLLLSHLERSAPRRLSPGRGGPRPARQPRLLQGQCGPAMLSLESDGAAPGCFRIKTAARRAPALCRVCLANLLVAILSGCTAALQGTLFFLRASLETEAPSGEGLPRGLRARPERLSSPLAHGGAALHAGPRALLPAGLVRPPCCKTCLLLSVVTPSVCE